MDDDGRFRGAAECCHSGPATDASCITLIWRNASWPVRIDDDGANLSLSEPELLFQHESTGHLVVAPDGRRFLGLRGSGEPGIKPFTLVLDWAQML